MSSEYGIGSVWALTWVASCVISCFAFLAFFRGITRRAWMDSLTRHAYVIYIVHYVFVTWLHRSLMGVDAHAGIKFLIVFSGAVLLSWAAGKLLLMIPIARRVL